MDFIHAHTFHVTRVCELIIEGSATRWIKVHISELYKVSLE